MKSLAKIVKFPSVNQSTVINEIDYICNNLFSETVDELIDLKGKIAELKKCYEENQERLRNEARLTWSQDGKLQNIRFGGKKGHVTVSSKVKPKKVSKVDEDKFINQYGKKAFQCIFRRDVNVAITGSTEDFIRKAYDSNFPIEDFFDITEVIIPQEDCFQWLNASGLSLQDIDGIEADLWALHSTPGVTVTKKDK